VSDTSPSVSNDVNPTFLLLGQFASFLRVKNAGAKPDQSFLAVLGNDAQLVWYNVSTDYDVLTVMADDPNSLVFFVGAGSSGYSALQAYSYETGDTTDVIYALNAQYYAFSAKFSALYATSQSSSGTWTLASYAIYTGSQLTTLSFTGSYSALVAPMVDDVASSPYLMTIVKTSSGSYYLYSIWNLQNSTPSTSLLWSLGANTTMYTIATASFAAAQRQLFVTYTNILGSTLVIYNVDQQAEVQGWEKLAYQPYSVLPLYS